MKEIIRKLTIHIDPSLKPKDKNEKGIVGKVIDMLGFSGKDQNDQKKNENLPNKKDQGNDEEYTPKKSQEPITQEELDFMRLSNKKNI